MEKLRTIDDLVHDHYIPAWITTSNFISAILATFGALGVLVGVIALAVALAGSNSAYGQPAPGLTALAAAYLLAASLSVLALGSMVANLAGCRRLLQELVALKLKDAGVAIPEPGSEEQPT